ncbi:SRPBCC family protein [Paenibacillus sp. GCM10023248]|uniref:SRPBCC family protein n=1 Tax=unclassified Paenibacillus TaxID=185978 RepID=UPI00237930FA|nr:SRPBCC family protein [Paenibacillus sp. MAHUQ-63]MDD9271642.1 SRPBCC family protein [Paenibacillus sp. MAHUQ-63]
MLNNQAANDTTATVNGPELIVTRMFSAPRELVFRTWTDPAHLTNWWGPQGFTLTIHSIDVNPGGVWRYTMHGPDGTDYENKISYIEVIRPETLVYSHGDAEEDEQFRVTVNFADRDGRTELTMRSLFKSAEDLEYVVKNYGAVEGAKQTLDRLAQELAKL